MPTTAKRQERALQERKLGAVVSEDRYREAALRLARQTRKLRQLLQKVVRANRALRKALERGRSQDGGDEQAQAVRKLAAGLKRAQEEKQQLLSRLKRAGKALREAAERIEELERDRDGSAGSVADRVRIEGELSRALDRLERSRVELLEAALEPG